MFIFIISTIITLVFLEIYFKKNNKKRREYVKRTRDRNMDNYEDNFEDKNNKSKGYFSKKEIEINNSIDNYKKQLKRFKYIWLPILVLVCLAIPTLFLIVPFYLVVRYFTLKKKISQLKRRRIVLYNLKK